MSLATLYSDIEKTSATARINLDDIKPNVRGSWGTAIAEAQAKLKDLRKSYSDALQKQAVGVFLSGAPDQVGAFGKLVVDEKEGLVVSADALYLRLTAEVERTISEGTRQWGVGQTQKLHSALMEVMHEVGLSEIPMPSQNDMPVVKTPADTQRHITNIIRAATGDSLNKRYMDYCTTNQAIEIGFVNTVTPVFITEAASDEVEALGKLYAKGFTTVEIKDADAADKEFMAKVFKDVNKRIFKKNK